MALASSSARRTQHQPLGLEDGDASLSEGLRRNPIQQCHRTGSLKAKRGAGIPSPLMEPVWVRRFDWMPADLD